MLLSYGFMLVLNPCLFLSFHIFSRDVSGDLSPNFFQTFHIFSVFALLLCFWFLPLIRFHAFYNFCSNFVLSIFFHSSSPF